MTRDHGITETPADIAAALGLVIGQRYSAQVITRDVVVHMHESATAPAADAPAHVIVSREPFHLKPAPGMGIYLWTAAGGAATVVVTESA